MPEDAEPSDKTPMLESVDGETPTELQRFIAATSDRFVFETQLRSSGTAITCRVRDRKFDQVLALKIFRTAFGPNSVDIFSQNIESSRRVSHPQIVPVLECGCSDGRLWYTMPYREGPSLQERLQPRMPMEEAEVVRLLHDVAEVLQYLHEQGVVHGDLKPGNILYSGGRVHIADVCVADAFMRTLRVQYPPVTSQRLNTVVMIARGTTGYMSPEQAGGTEPLDARADLYALGAIAYKLLTGQRPFGDASGQTYLAMQVSARAVPVLQRVASVNPLLDQVVMQLLAPSIEDRPQSAARVLAVLDKIRAGVTTLEPVPLRQAKRGHQYGNGPAYVSQGNPQSMTGAISFENVLRMLFNALRQGAFRRRRDN